MYSLSTQAKVLCQEVFQLERSGRYDDALHRLASVWKDKSSLPNVEEFNKSEAAEIVLRCGSVFGYLGHLKQIPNSQEKSKDLITEAHGRFLEIYDLEKIAECENYLALCYWRKGESVEAQAWVDSALSHDLPTSSNVRVYSYVIRNMLTNDKGKYIESIENFTAVENDFKQCNDAYLNGIIFSNLGIAHRNLGNNAEALKFFELSRVNYREAGHQIYLGTLENNFSLFYKSLGKFDEAHYSIDIATEIFKALDKTRYGYSYDTKALIYLEEGNYREALESVDKGINFLRNSENVNYFVETLSTKAKVLVKLNRIADAALCLSEAVEIARIKIGGEKAAKLAEDFAIAINETKSPVLAKVYTERQLVDEDIEIVLPSEIAHFDEIEGVWIKNKHLEQVGLKKGSLAIIVKEDVNRGDLVAVLERDSEEVICGFYDVDFGIICLEALDRKPQLFDKNEIQILGKIVGVANSMQEDEKKMYVELIEAFR